MKHIRVLAKIGVGVQGLGCRMQADFCGDATSGRWNFKWFHWIIISQHSSQQLIAIYGSSSEDCVIPRLYQVLLIRRTCQCIDQRHVHLFWRHNKGMCTYSDVTTKGRGGTIWIGEYSWQCQNWLLVSSVSMHGSSYVMWWDLYCFILCLFNLRKDQWHKGQDLLYFLPMYIMASN